MPALYKRKSSRIHSAGALPAAAAALLSEWGVAVGGMGEISEVLAKYAQHRTFTRGDSLRAHLINCYGDPSQRPDKLNDGAAKVLDRFLHRTSELCYFQSDEGLRVRFAEMANAYRSRTGVEFPYDESIPAQENIRRLTEADLKTIGGQK